MACDSAEYAMQDAINTVFIEDGFGEQRALMARMNGMLALKKKIPIAGTSSALGLETMAKGSGLLWLKRL